MTLILKILVLVSYVAMLVMNYLANSIPFNNQSTGAISDKYPTLFTPAGFTFSIWGIIYLFLGVYVIKMLFMPASLFNGPIVTLGWLFVLSSIFNIVWLVSWHYDQIFISTIVMLFLLIVLGFAFLIAPKGDALIRSPFSMYFAWICVATIANISILLVKANFGGFGVSEFIWLAIILSVAGILAVATILLKHDVVFGLVFLWAFLGILIKHLTEEGLQTSYSFIISYIIVLMVIVLISVVAVFIQNGFKLFH